MKLRELLEQFDHDSDVRIQIAYELEDFGENYDVFRGNSPVLYLIEDMDIDCLTAIDRGRFRCYIRSEEILKSEGEKK